MKTRKWIPIAVATLAAALLLVAIFRPRAVPVDVAAVRRGDLVVTVDEDGRTRVIDRYVVTAPIAGEVARFELHPGDGVSAGDVLARISPAPPPLLDVRSRAEAEARVRAAEAEVKRARASVLLASDAEAFARRELERIRALTTEGALTEQALDSAQLEADSAARQLDSARFGERVAAHQLEMARAALSGLRGGAEPLEIRSPVSGQVLRVPQESGGVLPPGTPLIEVGDPDALEIVVDVLTPDAVGVVPGAPVRIDGWGGGRPLGGRVRRVEPSAFTKVSALGVEEQRVNVIVDIDQPPRLRENLGDGFRVDVHITTWRGEGLVVAPASALFRRGERWACFVVEDGRARLRLVRAGHRSSFDVEIVEGLRPGEVVVVHPGDRVDDGVRVKPLEAPGTSGELPVGGTPLAGTQASF